MTPDLRVLSLGGGTQSCALALMSAAGDLPKLDHVVFADTQGELPETYAYLDYLRPILAAAEIPFTVVTAGSLEAALRTTEPTSSTAPPPAHVINPDGSKGRISRYRCSYGFKRRIIEREVKRMCGGRGAWKSALVEQWIGFSADEIGRAKDADGCGCGHKRHHHADGGCTRCTRCTGYRAWQINRWPLIEMRMWRDDTIRWFADNGHPTPPRSACWFCPNSGNDRWSALKSGHADLFERAVTLDRTIRGGGGFNNRGNQPFRGQLFLHSSAVPLDEADLRTARQIELDSGQGSFFNDDELSMDCSAGVCFT